MFENVAVAVNERDGGQDPVALAKKLVSSDGELTLVHVVVGENNSASDSALAYQRPERERALDWLTALRDEARADAQCEGRPASGSRPILLAHCWCSPKPTARRPVPDE